VPVARVGADTGEPQTLAEIREWHLGIVEALLEQIAAVHRAIRTDSSVASRFLGMTEADVDNYHDARRRELDRLTMLNLVASVEAALRMDYLRRVQGKLKDQLASAYRKWHSNLSPKMRRHPPFDRHGILDALKRAGVVNAHLVGRYRECLPVRHWLGHGRYWTKPTGAEQLNPEEVYARAVGLLNALPP
jgi:hypothetical protein